MDPKFVNFFMLHYFHLLVAYFWVCNADFIDKINFSREMAKKQVCWWGRH